MCPSMLCAMWMGSLLRPRLSGEGSEALGRWKAKDYWSQVCTYTALLADHYWCMLRSLLLRSLTSSASLCLSAKFMATSYGKSCVEVLIEALLALVCTLFYRNAKAIHTCDL